METLGTCTCVQSVAKDSRTPAYTSDHVRISQDNSDMLYSPGKSIYCTEEPVLDTHRTYGDQNNVIVAAKAPEDVSIPPNEQKPLNSPVGANLQHIVRQTASWGTFRMY